MKKYIVVCLFLMIAVLTTGCSNEEMNVVEAASILTETPTKAITLTPTPPSAPTATLTPIPTTVTKTPTSLPYVECPENGEGIICFGDYYNELPRTEREYINVVPDHIILHWDGRPVKPYDKWLSTSTWHGLAAIRPEPNAGGRSAHFGVGRDGIGQFLPMYETTVKQSYAANIEMDTHCINIEISGSYFDVIVTGGVEEDYITAIEEVSNLTLDLVVRLMDQYNIPIENIKGHYQVLTGKDDPGELWLQKYFLPKLKVKLAQDNFVLETDSPVK